MKVVSKIQKNVRAAGLCAAGALLLFAALDLSLIHI